MGIHPVCPGNPRYEITSPVFESVEINLDTHFYSGKNFKIIYIQSVSLNGKKLNRLWITHDEIVEGGVLEFEMGNCFKIYQ